MKNLTNCGFLLTVALLIVSCESKNTLPPPPPPPLVEHQEHDKKNLISYDENLGDYYFSETNYERALEYYNKAKLNSNANSELISKIQKTKYAIAQKQHTNTSESKVMQTVGACFLGVLIAYFLTKGLTPDRSSAYR